jgi:hypothetical protein
MDMLRFEKIEHNLEKPSGGLSVSANQKYFQGIKRIKNL